MELITQGAAESTAFFAGSRVGCLYQRNLTLKKNITNSAACVRKIMIIPFMVIDLTVFGPIRLTLITHLTVRIERGGRHANPVHRKWVASYDR